MSSASEMAECCKWFINCLEPLQAPQETKKEKKWKERRECTKCGTSFDVHYIQKYIEKEDFIDTWVYAANPVRKKLKFRDSD